MRLLAQSTVIGEDCPMTNPYRVVMYDTGTSLVTWCEAIKDKERYWGHYHNVRPDDSHFAEAHNDFVERCMKYKAAFFYTFEGVRIFEHKIDFLYESAVPRLSNEAKNG